MDIERRIRLPRPVAEGARVGVAALSGPVDPQLLDRGLETLRSLGLEPVAAPNLLEHRGLFAGSDAARLQGFEGLLGDPGIEAIVFARGGHGVLRLLPHIDWPLIAARRLALVGYSDLTPLLNEVVRRCSMVAFHGPMVATDLAREPLSSEIDCFMEMLAGHVERRYTVRPLRAGRAEGILLGGCLSMIAATAGTPFFPSFAGSVLVLEDIGEPAYRWDRMLTQLILSGSLDDACGLVLGHFDQLETKGLDSVSWQEWLHTAAGELEMPMADGLAFGHGTPNLTLPFGAHALLDADSCRFSTSFPA